MSLPNSLSGVKRVLEINDEESDRKRKKQRRSKDWPMHPMTMVMENDKTDASMQDVTIFDSGRVMQHVVKFLDMKEITKLRGVSHLFNNELTFEFELIENGTNFWDVKLKYKNKYMIDIINDQCCGTLEKFISFYAQMVNINFGAMVWKALKVDADYVEKLGSCSLKYVTSLMDFNSGDHYTSGIAPIWDICKKSSSLNPFVAIYQEMNNLKQIVNAHTFLDGYFVDLLILSRCYHFKPWKDELTRLIETNEAFKDSVTWKPAPVPAPPSMEHGGLSQFLWKDYQPLVGVLSCPTDMDDDPRKGRRSLFADSSVLGNFDVYEKYIESLNGDTSPIRRSDAAFTGIFAMFSLFMRMDLAKDYVHFDGMFFESHETLF